MNKVNVKKCAFCGKEFILDKRNFKKHKYCSPNCQVKAKWKEVQTPKILASIKERKCKRCGKMFKPHIRNHTQQIFCSLECQHKFLSKVAYERRKSIRKHPFKDLKKYWLIKAQKQVYENNRSALMRYFYQELLKRKDEVGWISTQDWLDIKKRYNYCCAKCGIKERVKNSLTIDHKKSISVNGGKNIKKNIQPLCMKCQIEKSKKEHKLYSRLRYNKLLKE